MMGMSPYRPPKGPHKNLRIKRKRPQKSQGSKISSCDDIVLYTGLSGRVHPLRSRDTNLASPEMHGLDSQNERKVVLTPNFPLCEILKGDILCIPWGVRPNTWCPRGAPSGSGSFIVIETPTGNQTLSWNGNSFSNANIIIQLGINGWEMTGEVNYQFNTIESFVFEDFPTGYSFQNAGGYEAEFTILKVDRHEDDLGRIGFYTLIVETLDTPKIFLQE